MKRFLFIAQVLLFGLFIICLFATIFQVSGGSNPFSKPGQNTPVYNQVEEYDHSLLRLNSLEKLERYCDSIYAEKVGGNSPVEFEKTYTNVVLSVVRKRFFHGYSYYSLSDNYMAVLVSKATIPGLIALVMPEDILKYPFAACSQQSIVMMELLQNKGFTTRKVSFEGKTFGGHFAFEVQYDGAWHFFDPNLEPDEVLLSSYGMPGIEFLVRHPEVLLRAYYRSPREQILDIFPTYSYGTLNKFPAPKAIIFQKVTHFLSYTIWLFFLLFFLVARRKYIQARNKMDTRRNRAPGLRTQSGAIPLYYPGHTA